MSENKCPICGFVGWVIEYPDDNGSGWFCDNQNCSFSCNPQDLEFVTEAIEYYRRDRSN